MSAEPFLYPTVERFAETIGQSPDTESAIAAPPRRPIILLSVLPRSGTNYLSALLALHPQCRQSRIPEDFFLANSALLISFCRSVAESWDEWWRQYLGGVQQLIQTMGKGLLTFADPGPQDEADSGAALMLRSPSIEGIDDALRLFPDAQLLILVRGGPGTVESGHRSFGWGYDDGIRAWRRSVRRLLAFMDDADPRRYRLVRFEDLVENPAQEICAILEFLQLDHSVYPFQRIDSVAVIGSSSFGRVDGEPVHWRPVPKTDEFDPLSRARGWPRHRQKRWAWLGGPEKTRLGYRVEPLSAGDRLLNIALDLCHGLRRAVLCIARAVQCRPRLFAVRHGRYLAWRHLNKTL